RAAARARFPTTCLSTSRIGGPGAARSSPASLATHGRSPLRVADPTRLGRWNRLPSRLAHSPTKINVLTKIFVGGHLQTMSGAAKASTAAAALHPMRRRILAALAQPGSATTVGKLLELPRQKVNYHLRVLERAGYLDFVEE